MKIIGSTINKVSAERKKIPEQGMTVKSNIDIKELDSEKLNFTSQPGLKLDFVFTVMYEPDVANVEIKGSVLILDDTDESKTVLKDWKKKKFENPIKIPLFNFIMDKCNLRSLELESELGLPLHISFPRLKAETK